MEEKGYLQSRVSFLVDLAWQNMFWSDLLDLLTS